MVDTNKSTRLEATSSELHTVLGVFLEIITEPPSIVKSN